MNHCFDVGIATKYGLEEAILISHFAFWVAKNKANGKHLHDGKYWTYNSARAFSELFPYMAEGKIRRVLKKMQDDGIIETGNFNKKKWDRTNWYTFTNAFVENNKCIFQIQQMDVPKIEDGSVENEGPIPDIYPVGYPGSNTNSYEGKAKPPPKKVSRSPRFTPPTVEEVRAYCKERKNNVDPEHFIAHYESNGWKVGRNPMKSWKSSVITWEKNDYNKGDAKKPHGVGFVTCPHCGASTPDHVDFCIKCGKEVE